MFITIEDETGVANLVVWPSLFEKQCRIVLGANMLGVEGRVQREGLVVHIVVDKLIDLSDKLAGIGDQNRFPLPHGRGDEFHHGSAGRPDSRDRSARKARDIYVPDLHIDTLKLKPRNFR
jgi:error-prone DNA polymerase